MAFVVKDRVKQTSTTTGTTNMVLSGTSQGFQTFSSAISDGDTTTYAITDASGNFETGLGTWNNTTSTLARTTIYESSNSNNAVNFGAGTKDVFITLPASRSAVADQNGKTTFVDNIEVTGINVNKSTDPNITLRNTTAPSSTVVQLQGDASGTMWLLADGMNQANNSRIVMAVDGLEKFRINGGGSGNGAWGLGGQNYGTAGQCITSNGSTSAPTWQTPTVDLSSYSTTSTIASTYAPLSSPSLTGNPTAPTQTAGNSTTRLATTEFVTTAVSNLVDSAPGTLNTLNELASALGDDANFSTTVTNSIATKLPLSGGTMTGDLDMGSNDISTTGKVLFANMYATTGDLPSATNQHGMFAHVHATGKGYFAHGGNWIPLANESALASYLTTSSASSTYLTQSNASSTYLTQSNASSTYLTQSNATSTYMPKTGGTFTGSITANSTTSTDANTTTTNSQINSRTLHFRTKGNNAGISGQTYSNQIISSNGTNVALEIYTIGATGTPIVFGTNTTERLRISENGAIGLSGANYGTSGQVLTSNGSSSAPTWQTVSGGSSGMPTSGGTFTGAVTFNNSATVHVDSMFTFDGQNNYGIDFQLRGNNYDLVWYSAANTLKAWDNTRIRWGSGNDFDIYHDGSQTNFHIEQGTAPIVFSNNSNSELLKIESTGAVTVAGAFTLPTSDGATNQVLQTNGSGTVSWATVSGGGGSSTGDISFSGSTITSSGSTVTIDDELTVNNTIKLNQASGKLKFAGGGSQEIYFGDGTGADEYRGTIRYAHGTDTLVIATSGGMQLNGGEVTVSDDLKVDQSGGLITLDGNGHITSKQKLNAVTAGGRLTGTTNQGDMARIDLSQTTANQHGGYIQLHTANTSGTLTEAIKVEQNQNTVFRGDVIVDKHLRLRTTDDQATQWFIYNHTEDTLRFDNAGGNDELVIGQNGQIGIGGTNYGSSGQVLTSNGSGSAPSWQTVSGGGGGGSGISVSDATALAFQCG